MILESKNTKEIYKLKRSIHSASASFITKSKAKTNRCENNSSKILLKNNYNIKKIHDIISQLEKKLNLLHNININESDIYFLNNKNDVKELNNNISTNHILKRNNKRKINNNFSKTVYKFNNQLFLPTYTSKDNININNIKNKNIINTNKSINMDSEKRNKNELIPYPYKRIQKKLRKYFSFPKNKEQLEEQFPYYFIYNKFPFEKRISSAQNNRINNNEKQRFYNLKRNYQVNCYKNNENKKMEDKSINTDNILFNNHFKNLKFSELKNTNKDKCLFNNKLFKLINSSKYKKVFITTSNNKNKKE